MNLNDVSPTAERVVKIIGDLQLRGVQLWSEHGQLRYRAPKGSLSGDDLKALRESKDQIIALLGSSVRGTSEEQRSSALSLRTYRAPLSFSQLWHWNLFQLGKRRSARHVVSAMRVQGALSIEFLRNSAFEVVRRHDALRTRIICVDGTPIQEVQTSVEFEIAVDNLMTLMDGAREHEVRRLIEHDILRPIELAVDPLFAFRLLKLRDDEHVLIVTLDHLISDGFSMNILLRDLFGAYAQVSRGLHISLPEIPIQFAEYAGWQRSEIKTWREQHGTYWEKRLAGYRAVRAPVGGGIENGPTVGWAHVPVRIGKELKAELRDWCRDRGTTLPMAVFTAYVALILRWCNASDVVIQFQVNSRLSPKVQDTIGYFTSILYLRIEARMDERVVDLLDRVTDEYCRAHEHADSNYLAAQMPRPEFGRSNWFNWIPLEPRVPDSDVCDSALRLEPLHFGNPAVRTFDWDNDPEFVLFDNDEDVVGTVYFPLSRFAIDSMERLVHNFLIYTEASTRFPEQRIKDMPPLT